MPEQPFELKLDTGKVVTWPGADGEDAARRYVDCHRTPTGGTYTVVAWRHPSAAGTVTVLGDAGRIIG